MCIRKRITHLICAIALVAEGHQCLAQVWKDLDKGFGCYGCTSSGYEIAIDETNDRLLLSGTLFCGNDCEDWRMPAVWDGQQWAKLGDTLTSIYFLTIGTFRDEIYSSNSIEDFDDSNFIKWNGLRWDTIPDGPKFSMYCMDEHDGFLYVAGAFDECAGDSANLIFRYDGETIEPLVNWFDDVAFGQTIAFYNDSLFVGGRFFNDEDQVFNLGSVYDKNVHRVGQGLNSNCNVEALEVHDGVLWIGGAFGPGNFGSNQWNYLAYYDGRSIQLSPWQPDGRVTALKSYNNELYMAGWFAHIEDLESHCVAKINDFGYYSLNPDTVYSHYHLPASYQAGIVRDMEIWNDTLYMSGAFGAIGLDTNLNSIAKLNRSLSNGSQFLDADLSLYPNPTNNNITLETHSYFNQNANIKVYDPTGRLVVTNTWYLGERRKEISLSPLADGLYLLTIETANGLVTKRFVKDD